MKFEYKNNHLILRVLTAEYADAVLSFYRRNREQFDIYETDKPDHFTPKHLSSPFNCGIQRFCCRKTHPLLFV